MANVWHEYFDKNDVETWSIFHFRQNWEYIYKGKPKQLSYCKATDALVKSLCAIINKSLDAKKIKKANSLLTTLQNKQAVANVKRMLHRRMNDKNIDSGNYLQFSSCADIQIGSISTAGPVNKQKREKKSSISKKDNDLVKKVKITGGEENAEDNDSDDPFISNTRVEESTSSRLYSKDSSSSSSSQRISAGSRGDVNNPGYDRPCTPPHQIHSISRNQDLLRRLREEKLRAKSKIEPICSNIIDTTNKHLMERLQLNCDYHLEPIINDTTKYIDELIESSDTRSDLRQKLQVPFVPLGETYSFDKHYEISWAHRFADKLLSLFEAPRNPLLDRNSEGWINCHLLAPLIDDCFLTCEEIQIHRCEEMSLASIMRKNISREESEKKQPGHKIDIIFRIDDMEYFSAETFTEEDPHNSKPIYYKYKLFREMKDQLDRLLKKLKFTKETIKNAKSIVLHGMSHRGFNGSMYAMYYDVDLEYYFVFELCQYRIGTTMRSVTESLVALKDVLQLKNDIIRVLDVVKEIKKTAIRTNSNELFTIENLPETTSTPKK
ncbi:23345_t:CDS:10 [Gigaspora margarita]|uniref:23345_t:CDS:1 n=1 Tax=Gigaspora margarita TaxID=4874 RepID=A0ABN7V9Q7_GIGMA|nr:23345_t:CDS:10 [Gigaspora margarita]